MDRVTLKERRKDARTVQELTSGRTRHNDKIHERRKATGLSDEIQLSASKNGNEYLVSYDDVTKPPKAHQPIKI